MTVFNAIVRMGQAELFAEQTRFYIVIMEDDVTLAGRMWKRGNHFPAVQVRPEIFNLIKLGSVKGVQLVEIEATEQPRTLVAPPVAVQNDPTTGELLMLPGDAQAVRLAGQAIEPMVAQARAPGVYPIEMRAALLAQIASQPVQQPSSQLDLAKQYLRAGGVTPVDFPDTSIGTSDPERQVRTLDKIAQEAVDAGKMSAANASPFLPDGPKSLDEVLPPQKQPQATSDLSGRAQDDLAYRLAEQQRIREQTMKQRSVTTDDQAQLAQEERQRLVPNLSTPPDQVGNILANSELARIADEQRGKSDTEAQSGQAQSNLPVAPSSADDAENAGDSQSSNTSEQNEGEGEGEGTGEVPSDNQSSEGGSTSPAPASKNKGGKGKEAKKDATGAPDKPDEAPPQE